jgi:hypothetical protein
VAIKSHHLREQYFPLKQNRDILVSTLKRLAKLHQFGNHLQQNIAKLAGSFLKYVARTFA